MKKLKPTIPTTDHVTNNPRGRGIPPGYTVGERVHSFSELTTGERLVMYCRQFESTNTIRVTGLRPAGDRNGPGPIQLMDYIYSHPSEHGYGMAMWDFELAGNGNVTELYRLTKTAPR